MIRSLSNGTRKCHQRSSANNARQRLEQERGRLHGAAEAGVAADENTDRHRGTAAKPTNSAARAVMRVQARRRAAGAARRSGRPPGRRGRAGRSARTSARHPRRAHAARTPPRPRRRRGTRRRHCAACSSRCRRQAVGRGYRERAHDGQDERSMGGGSVQHLAAEAAQGEGGRGGEQREECNASSPGPADVCNRAGEQRLQRHR